MPTALAIFAHPDDIEFVAAGTLLQLARRNYTLHYCNLCTGNGGSVQMDGQTTAATRLKEAQKSAALLNATFHPPISNDLELTYTPDNIKKIAAIVRQAKPTIVLTHSPIDYMEDHTTASRLAVTATFAHGVPNFQTIPPTEPIFNDITIYHAMPHGLCTPLRQKIRAGLYVNTTPVHEQKRAALACHHSQKHWLDVSQGMDSYLASMDEVSRKVGQLSGPFQHAEGWRRHLHLGFSAQEIDPLKEALGDDCLIDSAYESQLDIPQ